MEMCIKCNDFKLGIPISVLYEEEIEKITPKDLFTFIFLHSCVFYER